MILRILFMCVTLCVGGMQRSPSADTIDQAVADITRTDPFVIAGYFQRHLTEGALCQIVEREGIQDFEFVRKPDADGNTWLHYAAFYKMPNLIAMIARCCGVHMRNNDGLTPLAYAMHNNRARIVYSDSEYRATIRQLLGVWHTYYDLLHYGGLPVLCVAVGKGDFCATQALLQAGYKEYWEAVSPRKMLAALGHRGLHCAGRTPQEAEKICACFSLVRSHRQ